MKKIEVNTPWVPDKNKLYALFDDILESKVLTNNGKYVKLLEDELKKHTESKYAYVTSNGTIALHIALKALGIDSGEIITTPFSFIATTSSIIWQGCTPVFVDIEPDTLCIDPCKIESKINSRTKAILAVHIFGSSCDIESLEKIGEKYNIPTIYDGAHAFGVSYKGKSILSYGTVSTLSMHASKVISSVEGGAIFCNDNDIAEKIFKIRYFGKNIDNVEEMIGTNGKMNEFNAAFGILSIENYNNELNARNTIARKYSEALKDIRTIKLLSYKYNDSVNHAYYPIIMKNETEALTLISRAKEINVILRRYWYPSLNTLPFVKAEPQETPISVSSAKRTVCLPIYSSMSEEDQDRVISLFV